MAKIDLGLCESQQRQLYKDIQTKAFKPFYLIWGAEAYLRLQCLNNLVKALLVESNSVNKLVMADDKIDLQEALNFAQTPPFFGTRRVVVINGGSFFKKNNRVAKEFFDAPVSDAVIVFTDTVADTDAEFYSFVNGVGRTVRCETPNITSLRKWVEQRLVRQAHKKVEPAAIEHFLQFMDADMFRISSEMDKLIAYTMDQEEITTKDISAICSVVEEANLYKLTDAIADQNRKAAVSEYESLLRGETKPSVMISSITKQLRGVMVTAELLRRHADTSTIADCIGMGGKAGANFVVSKYTGWARKMNENRLIGLVDFCLRMDYEFKSGKLNDTVALEMLIARCTS